MDGAEPVVVQMPCASRRAPIEQGGRQFARLVCEFRLARGIAVHLRAQAGGFCFSFLVTLENRCRVVHLAAKLRFLSFSTRPRPDTKRRTSANLPSCVSAAKFAEAPTWRAC